MLLSVAKAPHYAESLRVSGEKRLVYLKPEYQIANSHVTGIKRNYYTMAPTLGT